ncbi:MAG: hypothetical protein LBM93_10420 [Oscillospiraceae bacterium]|jgi:hypothetical protein|nr:hypothetical protein [Oscillospiraceae bacterium]
MSDKKKVLMGSPVRRNPKILKHFIESLYRIKKEDIILDFFFIDDNDIDVSRLLLDNFNPENSKVIIKKITDERPNYQVNEITHSWNSPLMVRVAQFRNMAMDYARDNGYDYIFNIDTDEIIHPQLINHLISLDKPIVSEILWSKWTPNGNLLPNAWKYDQYKMDSPEESAEAFLDKLRKKGVYSVGGFGGVSLIKREALERGLSFSPIPNISLIGEDRWLCVRAKVLGYDLLIDTYYPIFHIYREKDIEKLEEYLSEIEQ